MNGLRPYSRGPGGAPKQLWPAMTRMFRAFAWPPFLSRKFTFFIARMKKAYLVALCLMKAGKITPEIDKRYPLSGTADAIAYVEQGHARGKVVVSFD